MSSNLEGLSLIERFSDLTGCSDGEIATLLAMPRSTVQSYRTGRYTETLTLEQVDKLVTAARAYRDQVQRIVAELEMLT